MSTFKTIIRYLAIIVFGTIALPFAIPAWIEKKLLKQIQIFFDFGAHAVSLVPGRPGNFVRAAYYIICLDYFHPTSIISFGSFFSKRNSRMAQRSGIGAYSIIGLVDIGQNTRIASRVSIISGLHTHGSTDSMGDIDNHEKTQRIFIGENVWIGEGAVVGADIGDNSIIGTGAVVVNRVPPRNFAMGNPARLLPTTAKDESEVGEFDKASEIKSRV